MTQPFAGVFGSAFTILLTRLFNEEDINFGKKDLKELENNREAFGECLKLSFSMYSQLIHQFINMHYASESKLTPLYSNITEDFLKTDMEKHDEVPDKDVDSEEESDSDEEDGDKEKEEDSESDEDDLDTPDGVLAARAKTGIWERVFTKLSARYTLLSSRRGRAAFVNNFLHGLALHKVYPFSPFTGRKGGSLGK